MSRLERRNMRLFIVRGFSRLHFLVRVFTDVREVVLGHGARCRDAQGGSHDSRQYREQVLVLSLHHDKTWNSTLATPSAHCLISPSVSQPHFGQVWGEAQHSQSWGLGVLRDSRMFSFRQQGSKHLALRCSWCH
jgi:hypothetical protein